MTSTSLITSISLMTSKGTSLITSTSLATSTVPAAMPACSTVPLLLHAPSTALVASSNHLGASSSLLNRERVGGSSAGASKAPLSAHEGSSISNDSSASKVAKDPSVEMGSAELASWANGCC